VFLLEPRDGLGVLGAARALRLVDRLGDRGGAGRLELLAQALHRELLRGLDLGAERRELALVADEQLVALGAELALGLGRRGGIRRALVREILLELRDRRFRRRMRLRLGLELLLELRDPCGRRVEARLQLLDLAAVVEQLLLELAVLRLERGLRVLRLAQLLLRLGELLALLLERRLDLLELALLREVRLAEVQELRLAAAALG